MKSLCIKCKTETVYKNKICRYCVAGGRKRRTANRMKPCTGCGKPTQFQLCAHCRPEVSCKNCGKPQRHRSGYCKNCRHSSKQAQRDKLASWLWQNRIEERHRNRLERLHEDLHRLMLVYVSSYGHQNAAEVQELIFVLSREELTGPVEEAGQKGQRTIRAKSGRP